MKVSDFQLAPVPSSPASRLAAVPDDPRGFEQSLVRADQKLDKLAPRIDDGREHIARRDSSSGERDVAPSASDGREASPQGGDTQRAEIQPANDEKNLDSNEDQAAPVEDRGGETNDAQATRSDEADSEPAADDGETGEEAEGGDQQATDALADGQGEGGGPEVVVALPLTDAASESAVATEPVDQVNVVAATSKQTGGGQPGQQAAGQQATQTDSAASQVAPVAPVQGGAELTAGGDGQSGDAQSQDSGNAYVAAMTQQQEGAQTGDTGGPSAFTPAANSATSAATESMATAPVLPVSADAPTAATSPAAGNAASAPAVPELDNPTEQAALNRVTHGLQGALKQSGGVVTLRLNPPEMGMVRIQMEIQNGTVSASLQSETPSVRVMLSQQLAQLRAGLETQGLSVERLNVQGLSQSGQANLTSSDSQQQEQQQQGLPDDGRSRGQYARSGNGSGGRQSGDGSGQPADFDDALEDMAQLSVE